LRDDKVPSSEFHFWHTETWFSKSLIQSENGLTSRIFHLHEKKEVIKSQQNKFKDIKQFEQSSDLSSLNTN